MTLAARDADGTRLWKCDECGHVGPWAEPESDWRVWGSVATEDALGQDELPTICSDQCQALFSARIAVGQVEVRDVKPRGHGYTITGRRKGY
ncbi:MAG TPA: hypothetical protein VIG24_07815 [Acidimicrobiia bacterium]